MCLRRSSGLCRRPSASPRHQVLVNAALPAAGWCHLPEPPNAHLPNSGERRPTSCQVSASGFERRRRARTRVRRGKEGRRQRPEGWGQGGAPRGSCEQGPVGGQARLREGEYGRFLVTRGKVLATPSQTRSWLSILVSLLILRLLLIYVYSNYNNNGHNIRKHIKVITIIMAA